MARLFAPKAAKSEPVVESAPLPQPAATKDDIRQLVEGFGGVAQQLTTTVAQLSQKMEEMSSRQPQVVVQQQYPQQQQQQVSLSDQDIDNAILTGQGAGMIRALIDREVNRKIEQRVKPLEEYGVNTIGELSRRITTGGMKHYPRFKKEIEERLNMLTPDVRANPTVIETIYNAVVGTHTEELTREAAEAAIRQAQEPVQDGKSRNVTPGTGAGGSQVTREGTELPDMQQFLGSSLNDGIEALQHKGSGGQDQDAFARGMGYSSFADYMKQYKELQASEGTK